MAMLEDSDPGLWRELGSRMVQVRERRGVVWTRAVGSTSARLLHDGWRRGWRCDERMMTETKIRGIGRNGVGNAPDRGGQRRLMKQLMITCGATPCETCFDGADRTKGAVTGGILTHCFGFCCLNF